MNIRRLEKDFKRLEIRKDYLNYKYNKNINDLKDIYKINKIEFSIEEYLANLNNYYSNHNEIYKENLDKKFYQPKIKEVIIKKKVNANSRLRENLRDKIYINLPILKQQEVIETAKNKLANSKSNKIYYKTNVNPFISKHDLDIDKKENFICLKANESKQDNKKTINKEFDMKYNSEFIGKLIGDNINSNNNKYLSNTNILTNKLIVIVDRNNLLKKKASVIKYN